jgi:hypothetical protein
MPGEGGLEAQYRWHGPRPCDIALFNYYGAYGDCILEHRESDNCRARGAITRLGRSGVALKRGDSLYRMRISTEEKM